jgi:hypothetical protein
MHVQARPPFCQTGTRGGGADAAVVIVALPIVVTILGMYMHHQRAQQKALLHAQGAEGETVKMTQNRLAVDLSFGLNGMSPPNTARNTGCEPFSNILVMRTTNPLYAPAGSATVDRKGLPSHADYAGYEVEADLPRERGGSTVIYAVRGGSTVIYAVPMEAAL